MLTWLPEDGVLSHDVAQDAGHEEEVLGHVARVQHQRSV
jgi:hypothetical protein